MKYALLFFSFLFIFILNIDSANAQTKCDPSMGKRCASGTITTLQAPTPTGRVSANCGPNSEWYPEKSACGPPRNSASNSNLKWCETAAARNAMQPGCCDSSARSWGPQYCNQTTCDRNMKRGGSGTYWYDGRCNSTAQSSQASSFKCKDGSDPDPNNTDPNKACFCSAGVTVARDQDCPANTKGTDPSKCSQKVANYSVDRDNKCVCGGEEADKFVENNGVCTPKSGTVANFLKICADAGGGGEDYSEHGGPQICTCESNKAEIDPTKQKCPAVASKAGDTPSCLQAFKTAAEACEKEGVQAVKECNSENKDSNDQMKASQGVIDVMSQVMQMRGQQQGSAETCFQAGALASTSYGVLDLMKKDCDEKIVTCQDECKKAKDAYKEVKDGERCNAEIARAGTIAQQEEAKKKLFDQADKIFAKLESGTEACEKDAKTNQDTLINVMNRMNKSAQQAAKCQCQLTAGQTNCDQILGPADCKLTPKDPRCPQVVTVKCAGTDYNTKECICLRDPKATSCIGTTGSGASQVAGFNPVGAGSTNFKMGGAGSGGGLGDFPSDSAAAVSMDKTQGGVDSPFSAASGGGGGGSSGGGGGSDGGSSEGGAAEPEAKTGIAGLFNNLKTGVAGLFGGNGAKKSTAEGKNFSGKASASKNIDPNQWRPVGLRGIAGGNGIGSKNSDIFKTVNNQYNNQYHTLMTLPAEGPK